MNNVEHDFVYLLCVSLKSPSSKWFEAPCGSVTERSFCRLFDWYRCFLISHFRRDLYIHYKLSIFEKCTSWAWIEAQRGICNLIEIAGRSRFCLTFLEINLERSINIVKGLAKSSAILGYDFMRETYLVVTGQNVFFRDLKKEDWVALSVLHTTGRLSVPARSTLTVKLNVKDLHGKPLPVGTACLLYTSPSPRD